MGGGRRPRVFFRIVIAMAALMMMVVFALWTAMRREEAVMGNGDESSAIDTPGDGVNDGGRNMKKKMIVYWTPFFGSQSTATLDDCPLRDSCTMSANRSDYLLADAVIFHMSDFSMTDLPRSRSANQRYVFLSMEAPPSLPQLDHIPGGFFNWTQTHLLSSRVPMPYGGWWAKPEEVVRHSAGQLRHEQLEMPDEKELAGKKAPVFWLVSNCKTPSHREDVIAELAKHIPIDVIGQCTGAWNQAANCSRTDSQCLDALFHRYYFYVAIENNICEGYITEKYWDRYPRPAVPIVLRRWVYQDRLPEKSFIAVDDYKNASEMAAHLQTLIANPTQYLEYFAYRNQGYDRIAYNAEGYRLGYCRLCEELINADEHVEVIDDVAQWYREQSRCEGDAFVREWIAQDV